MDAVMSFNAELAALYECKPPISKAKMTSITKAAIKAIKYYKHIVQSVEKFIQKCKTEYKIPGLYVIDSIVRQSRHQFGSDKDLFAPRFGKNILITFYYLFKCPPEEKSRVIRVLNLWQKNNVFEEDVIQPIFDISDTNHPTYKEISNQIHQKAAKVKQPVQQSMHTTPQQQQNQTPQHQHTPQTPQTPQPSHSIASMPTPTSVNTTIVSSMPNQVNNTVVTGLDPNLIQQIQQILMKTEEGVAASSVAVLSGLSNQSTNFLQTQPPPVQVPIHQPPPTIMPPMKVQAPEQTTLIPGLSSSGDFDERTLPFVDTSLPPPGYLQNFSHNQSPHPVHAMATTTMMSQKPPSPKEEGEHSGESDEDKENQQDEVIQIDDRSRSPSYSRGSRRTRKRSRSRSRSRSRHHRSRSRGRRSGSRDRDRRYRDRDRNRSRRDNEKDQEREKEKERKKKGLPTIKADHVSVCSTTLWVGHLSKLVHQEELSDTFGEYGDIVSINLIPPRGCAFICMNRRQDAARALQKLRNYKMLNKAITIAWAPGKGVKGKEFKDYWEVDSGCSYVPYSKLTSMDTADLDALEEGGMIDEDTVPTWLKGKLSARIEASHKEEAHMKPQSNMVPMAMMPTGGPPLGIVTKDLVSPIIQPPFTLPNVPPPRIPPGSIPTIGPPLMPLIGVPPPMGMPPMNPVPNILGTTLISTVPPHMAMAAAPHHLRPPMPVTHVIADQCPNNTSHDSDSMDVEMEDMQRPETSGPPPTLPSTESGNEDSEKSPQKHNRLPPPINSHMAIEAARQENSPHSQPPPFTIRPPGAEPIGIRFGIVPRGVPGFSPGGMGIGGFLGPPPPIIAGRPGIVTESPRPFSPLAGPSDPAMNGRFIGLNPPRTPAPERQSSRMEEEKGGWKEDENDRRKFRNIKEPWSREAGNVNGRYDNSEGGRRPDRNVRSTESDEDSKRYRDRSRMRNNEDTPTRGHDRNFNRDDRSQRERDVRDRDRHRDRYDNGRDWFDQNSSYGRDSYRNDRRDQWGGGRGRWGEESRGWRPDNRNDERPNWNDDRWNQNNYDREEPAEEVNTGWMNSEDYAFRQQNLHDKPQEPERNRDKEPKDIEPPSDDAPPVNVSTTEKTSKPRKDRDSVRISRWEPTGDNAEPSKPPTPLETTETVIAQDDNVAVTERSMSNTIIPEDSNVNFSDPNRIEGSELTQKPAVESNNTDLMNSKDYTSQQTTVQELERTVACNNDDVVPDSYDPFEADSEDYTCPKNVKETELDREHKFGPSTPPATTCSNEEVPDTYKESETTENINTTQFEVPQGVENNENPLVNEVHSGNDMEWESSANELNTVDYQHSDLSAEANMDGDPCQEKTVASWADTQEYDVSTAANHSSDHPPENAYGKVKSPRDDGDICMQVDEFLESPPMVNKKEAVAPYEEKSFSEIENLPQVEHVFTEAIEQSSGEVPPEDCNQSDDP